MKKLYSTLIAMLAVVVFAGVAHADPGTTWEKKISKSRFLVLTDFDGAAVFDKETGRVWEQSPSTSLFNWANAQEHCNTLKVGNRMGWRLPTLQELASLVDSSQSSPALPPGHPFNNVSEAYSATTCASCVDSRAWVVGFSGGGFVGTPELKSSSSFAWCVRGGQGVDPQ